MRYLFEEYTFDTDRRELRRGVEVLSITPQVFDLLEYLIRNRERLVSKDDLINAVWSGRVVSDAALTTRLNAVRNAIGDTGEKQRLIKTLPRKGFRFVGAVHEHEGPAHGGAVTPLHTSAPRLSILVLPFANIGGDRDQDYFIDGVTESLTTDLSRINGAFVIAHSTAFTFKGRTVEVTKLGRELNVRYVLEGSVQRGDNRLRLNVQLIDAETGAHLWADRFDKSVSDLFNMQDEIVSRLANTLNARLIEVEARRAELSLHADAMELYFQGRAWMNKGTTPEHLTRARGFFERALAIAPRSVDALVGLAGVDVTMGGNLLTDDQAPLFYAAETNVIKALSLAPDDALAHWVLGALYNFTNRAAQGIAECQQALALDRNLAGAHGSIGAAKFLMGRADETEDHILEAFRLSPRDTGAYWWCYCVARAKIQLGADADAASWLRRSIEANRNFPLSHFGLAAVLALLGAVDEARSAAKAGLALDPAFSVRRALMTKRSDNPAYLAARERLCEGMRMAAVPEG